MSRLVGLSASLLVCTLIVAAAPANGDEPKSSGVLPAGMNGFRGSLRGKVVDKDPEKGTLRLEVETVVKTWPKNKAPDPQSAVGKTVPIDGVFGRFIDVLITVEKGQRVAVGAFTVALVGALLIATTPATADEPKSDGAVPAGMHGFRGMLRGKVVEKDAEKGTVKLEVDEIVKTWPKNKAKDPKSAVGKTIPIEGVFGRFLDVLITVEKGQRVEMEAFHNGGDVLTFPGEWLKKIE
jgi:hypothetical protein